MIEIKTPLSIPVVTSSKQAILIVLLLVLTLYGCSGEQEIPESAGDWERVEPESLSADLSEDFQRAEKARKDLAKTLFGRLSEVISNEGPKAAIEVCNVEAQGMTEEVGNEHGVSIGRTSFRLRNPNNQPPQWAKKFKLVENRVQRQVVLKSTRTERLAVFTPIHLASKCMTCHGPREQIPSSVKKELDKRYPQDKATGFHSGDLRGWFWVESRAREHVQRLFGSKGENRSSRSL